MPTSGEMEDASTEDIESEELSPGSLGELYNIVSAQGNVETDLGYFDVAPPYSDGQVFCRMPIGSFIVQGKYVGGAGYFNYKVFTEQGRILNSMSYTSRPSRQIIQALVNATARMTPIETVSSQAVVSPRPRNHRAGVGEFNYITAPTFIFGNDVRANNFSNDHYSERQRGRTERTQREYKKNEERNAQKYIDELVRLNKLLPEKDQYTNLCNYCMNGINNRNKDYIMYRSTMVCHSCINHIFRRCNRCSQYALRFDLTETIIRGELICEECASKCTFTCDMCERMGDDTHKTTLGDGTTRCGDCASNYKSLISPYNMEEEYEINHRSYSSRKLKQYCSEEIGSYVQSSRMYGVELECFYTNEAAAAKVLNRQPSALGVTGDGTIADNDDSDSAGIELQTPKLQGKRGEEFLFQLSKKLISAGFGVNKTCGMHVHLDSRDYLKPANIDAAKTLMAFYIVFEDVLLSLLPRSRRTNEYCRRLGNEYKLSDIINAEDMESLEKAWYKAHSKTRVEELKATRHDSRYSGINFHTFFSEAHMEVRFHNGTIVAPKVLEWVNLHCQVMDKIIKGDFGRSEIMAAQEESEVKDKAEIMFEMLGLSERSKEYFFGRQEKFKVRAKVEDEIVSVLN